MRMSCNSIIKRNNVQYTPVATNNRLALQMQYNALLTYGTARVTHNIPYTLNKTERNNITNVNTFNRKNRNR